MYWEMQSRIWTRKWNRWRCELRRPALTTWRRARCQTRTVHQSRLKDQVRRCELPSTMRRNLKQVEGVYQMSNWWPMWRRKSLKLWHLSIKLWTTSTSNLPLNYRYSPQKKNCYNVLPYAHQEMNRIRTSSRRCMKKMCCWRLSWKRSITNWTNSKRREKMTHTMNILKTSEGKSRSISITSHMTWLQEAREVKMHSIKIQRRVPPIMWQARKRRYRNLHMILLSAQVKNQQVAEGWGSITKWHTKTSFIIQINQ